MKMSLFVRAAFAVLPASGLLLSGDAQASTITFDSPFSVSDTFSGSASGLNAGESLDISFDSGRFPFVGPSLPRFDPSLGRLDSVTLDVEFDRSTLSLPVTLTDPAGGVTTATIDDVSVQRGLVFGVNTGLLRPLVISSSTESALDLPTLSAGGLVTTSPSSAQIDIATTGVGAFTPNDGVNVSPLLVEGPDSFSFTGTEDFSFVFRRLATVSVGADQDGVGLAVVDGRLEYAGTVSVTFDFTPIPEPASLLLLGSGGLLMAGRRRRVA